MSDEPTQSRSTPITDLRVLRAIAHPVRNRVLQEVHLAGHARAADVAAQLDIPANQASFHLRQLAKYGLIEPAPEHARDGRDRVWKPAYEHGVTISLDDADGDQDPGDKAAVAVFRRQATERAKQAVERAYAPQHDKGVFVGVGESALRLTRDEAKEFSEAMNALQEKWEERSRADDGQERTTYELLTILQPLE